MGKPAIKTIAFSGNAYIDGLFYDSIWAVSSLTYSFPASGAFYNIGHLLSGTITAQGSGYTNGTHNSPFPNLIALTGGGTTFQVQSIVVSGGQVTTVNLFSPASNGTGIQVGDTFTCDLTPGSGFVFTCTGVYYGTGEAITNFAQLATADQNSVRAAYSELAAMIGLTFTEIVESPTLHADLRHAYTTLITTAATYNPAATDTAGDSWYNPSLFNNPVRGNYVYMNYRHEPGHGLGLKHPNEFQGSHQPMPNGTGNAVDRDSLQSTIMSYRAYPGGSVGSAGGVSNGNFPQTYMGYDVQALQYGYGAVSTAIGTRSWSPTTGQETDDGTPLSAPSANIIFQCIPPTTGTLDFTPYSGNMTIDLSPQNSSTVATGWSTPASVQVANLTGGHFSPGSISTALDTNATNQIKKILCGSGNYTIICNDADNTISVGAGTNTIDGGNGTNTCAVPGPRNAYYFNRNSDGSWTVSDTRAGHTGSRNYLTNIQFIQFTDQIWPLANGIMLGGYNGAITQIGGGSNVSIGQAVVARGY